jgi:hypothetical protein
MRLSIILPWLCTVGLLAALGALYSASQKKDAELAGLRQDSVELQSLRAEVETNKSRSQFDADELARLRKNNEELLRLRNEVRQLNDEKATLTKQAQDSKAQAEQARAQAKGAQDQTEALRQSTAQAALQQAQATACINNLRLLETAKQAWAQASARGAGAAPTLAELTPFARGPLVLVCPAGGTYSVNAVGAPPTCSIPGHALPR